MTRTELPTLTPAERSVLLPVLSRARDAEAPAPILGDAWSRTVRDALAVDWPGLGLPRKEAYTVAIRGRRLDDWCRAFLDRHPDAVVVELGSGLDDRAQRVDPPATALWVDLDLPDVHALRRLLPPRPAVRAPLREVGADATDPGWLADLPRDRPLIAVGDGFLPFLAPADSARLVHRLVEHAPHGELVCNGYTTLARRLMPTVKAIRRLGIDAAGGTAFDDPRVPQAWHPRLRLVEREMLSRSPFVATMPARMRAAVRVLGWFPRLAARSDLGVLRYAW